MNRSALKSFASWSRSHLRDQVRAVLVGLGVSGRGLVEPSFVAGGMVVGVRSFDAGVVGLYRSLRAEVDARLRSGSALGDVVESLVDEGAYIWFNRLTALRFMEVNGFIGRVLSSTSGAVDPDLMRDASGLAGDASLPGVSAQVLEGWRRQGDAVTYRNLLVARCRGLAGVLPSLFGSGKDYLALFLPENLLHEASVVRRLVEEVPEEDWRDIEVVGWLYQFYIAERKDEVFAKKGAYEARDIAPATQIFTPHWIVRYLVENSVGRLWLESHPESGLREHMPYFVEVEGEPPKSSGNRLSPEELTVLDPACGSGHMLVYAFDLLYRIYVEAGYPERDIARLILTKNLFGVDLDERAAQLTAFALLMKGRERDRSILRDPPALNVVHTVATRGWVLPESPAIVRKNWQPLVEAFRDADSLGSLIDPPEVDFGALRAQVGEAAEHGNLEDFSWSEDLELLLRQSELLAGKYRVVVTNPPYMGSGSFGHELSRHVDERHPAAKQDLYAVFLARSSQWRTPSSLIAFVTMQTWMFLSGFEAFREAMLREYRIRTLMHMANGVMPIAFGTSAFVMGPATGVPEVGAFFWVEGNNIGREGVPISFPPSNRRNSLAENGRLFLVSSDAFARIYGTPVAYWASRAVYAAFAEGTPLGRFLDLRKGLTTGNNDRFIRRWHEIASVATVWPLKDGRPVVKGNRWFPLNKGGEFRKWYGNADWVVDWLDDGRSIRAYGTEAGGRPRSRVQNASYYFREAFSWAKVTSGGFSVRYFPSGFIPADAGSSAFCRDADTLLAAAALLNSSVRTVFVEDLAPTINFEINQIASVPVPRGALSQTAEAATRARKCVELARGDWDSFEQSWDFQIHPLVRMGKGSVAAAFSAWSRESEDRFNDLRRLEEDNNRYWIAAYGLQGELSPEVPERGVTVRRADLDRDIRSLISYAVGCMMGRYSLDEPGLIHAGQSFDAGRHQRFPADVDGIIPVTDEPYFDDDVVSRFLEFLRMAFDASRVEENLAFVADVLGRRAGESPLARLRRYFLEEFVKDHVKAYSKRPIYWLFTSGKERAFGALVYLHRYDQDTLARLRNEYALPLQSKLDAAVGQVERALGRASSASAVRQAEGQLRVLRSQQAELMAFQDRLQHLADQRIAIDLDDGVAYNYTLFEGLVYEGPDLKMADLMKRSQWKRDLIARGEA